MVLQVNYKDKWASDLIYGRYQVMESWLGANGSFYVFDNKADDQLRDKGGSIMYFTDPGALQAYIDQYHEQEQKKAAKASQKNGG